MLRDGSPGESADSAPRLSPDGARVAFLRGDGKDKSQVFVVDAGGGEPVQATDAPLGVSEFAWSPDGATIGFLARVAERGRYGSVEGLDASAEAPRRVTAVRWHANGLGYVADRPAQVFTVAAPATDSEPFYEPAALVQPEGETAPKKPVIADEPRQLTTGTASHSGIAFAGAEIVTIREELEAERRDLRTRVIAIAVDGSGERELVPLSADLAVEDLAVAADGTVALLGFDAGPDGTDFVAPGTALWLVEGEGVRRITDPEVTDLGGQPHHTRSAMISSSRTAPEVVCGCSGSRAPAR